MDPERQPGNTQMLVVGYNPLVILLRMLGKHHRVNLSSEKRADSRNIQDAFINDSSIMQDVSRSLPAQWFPCAQAPPAEGNRQLWRQQRFKNPMGLQKVMI